MYSKILRYCAEKPPLYSQSTTAFWNDSHISKYMLQAHLAPHVEAASRKLSFMQESVGWITNLCKVQKNNKLLDLGCGAGIYCELFCKTPSHVFGDIVGMDFSQRSIEYAINNAEAHQLQIQYIYQNYLDMDYEAEFDIVTLIYCDFGVLSAHDRQILLVKIKKALKKDGHLIIDGFTGRHLDDFSENQTIEYHDTGFWNEEQHICIKNTYLYADTHNYLEQYIIITDNDCQRYNIWNQIFTVDSLSRELHLAGFEGIVFFDDVCGKALSDTSKTLCAVARCG